MYICNIYVHIYICVYVGLNPYLNHVRTLVSRWMPGHRSRCGVTKPGPQSNTVLLKKQLAANKISVDCSLSCDFG